MNEWMNDSAILNCKTVLDSRLPELMRLNWYELWPWCRFDRSISSSEIQLVVTVSRLLPVNMGITNYIKPFIQIHNVFCANETE